MTGGKYSVLLVLVALMGYATESARGFVPQDKRVLVTEFSQQGDVPEIYMEKIRTILNEKQNIDFRSSAWWRFTKMRNEDREYLENEDISYVIEGEISFLDEEGGKRISISLFDSLMAATDNITFEFQALPDMEQSFREAVDDIFYYIYTNKSRRKVFIVKFRLVQDNVLYEDLASKIPNEIPRQIEKDDQLKTAFVFKFVPQEFNDWVIENHDRNVLDGTILTEDAETDIINIDVEIRFYQTQDDNILTSVKVNRSSNDLVDRAAREIVQKIKSKIAAGEINL